MSGSSGAVEGTRRILALDGGGIRGVLSLEVLARLEADLRERSGDGDLVLGDWFDLVGGTSTGAIIAAGLARGMTVEHLIRLYEDRGTEMFAPARWRERLRRTYDHTALERLLREQIGEDVTLGDPSLRCLLVLVMRNATTDSPWPLSSFPGARFNDRSLPDCNLDLPLWQLVRASTAAPVFFAPESVHLGDQDFVFVDGGLTPYNNPALQVALMATLPAYGLGWPTGEDRLLVVSVGTGSAEMAPLAARPEDMTVLHHAKTIPGTLIGSTATQQDLLCRVLGRCRHGDPIDAEVGDLVGGAGVLPEPLFSYVRYDVPLTQRALADLDLGDIDPSLVGRLDAVEAVADLRRIGRALAARDVTVEHLTGFALDGREARDG